MAHRILTALLGFLFLSALALNGYLLHGAVDGARIVKQVESAAGQALSCRELYQSRDINAYFEVQHPQEGNALYLLSLAWPVWFALSIGTALGLAGMVDRKKSWHWLPVIGMSLLVLGLILYLPAIAKINCAID